MCPFMSDVHIVNVDCNFSHGTTFNSLRVKMGRKMRQAYSLLSLYTYVNLFVCRYLLLCLLNDSAQQYNINVVLKK